MSAGNAFQACEQDWRELDLLLRGFKISRMLRLVADLGIADKIAAERSVTVCELAQVCAVLPEQLIRVLRALAAFRIFQVSADGNVSHTSMSHLFRTDAPNSLSLRPVLGCAGSMAGMGNAGCGHDWWYAI